MIKILASRQTGKTHQLIHIAKAQKALVLTFSKHRATELIKRYDYPHIMSIQQYQEGYNKGTGIQKVVVDDLDICLPMLINDIIGFSMTTDS